MNVFFLDRDPEKCAIAHYDTHVVKMILESAQLLSTAHHLCGSGGPYKVTHQNHPSAVWARATVNHYSWLYCLMIRLGNEYTHRFGKEHKTIRDHRDTLFETPSAIKALGWQDPPQAMPEHCQNEDAVTAYRNYYTTEKLNLMKYTNRETPLWLANKIGTTVSM
jgi:hypothetical protein